MSALPPFKFQTQTTRYSPQNAYWLAKAAQLAYTQVGEDNPAPDQKQILAQLKSWSDQFTQVEVFDHQSTQSFIARHEELIMVAFRGSDQWEDWLDNLNLPTIPTNLGRAHRGFQMALEDVWAEMLEKIKELKDRHQTLWLTGHSLGGALATLAAAERIDQDQTFNGVYTFGQPRCVDREMSRNMNLEAKSRIFRFQNNNDLVSRIPQRIMGYSHAGTFIYIDVNQNLHIDIHWWNQFLDRVGGILEALPKPGVDKIEDHQLKNYLVALAKNIEITPSGLG